MLSEDHIPFVGRFLVQPFYLVLLPRMMLSSDLSGRRDSDLRDVYLSAEVFVGKIRQSGERTEDSCGDFILRTIRAQ